MACQRMHSSPRLVRTKSLLRTPRGSLDTSRDTMQLLVFTMWFWRLDWHTQWTAGWLAGTHALHLLLLQCQHSSPQLVWVVAFSMLYWHLAAGFQWGKHSRYKLWLGVRPLHSKWHCCTMRCATACCRCVYTATVVGLSGDSLANEWVISTGLAARGPHLVHGGG
eukprot:GHRQ01017185.1.p2 GENE.GHRQ01017185.1~~GHRQ01017185.1.p2  ORF type:complete len:165 (-),score=19.11 GHRQ01017185.1:449-943(-)